MVLILTNAFSSLDKIKAYGLHAVDVVLTYSFLIFWGILEAVAAAIVLVLVEILLEKIIKKRLDLVFRLLLTAGLVTSWVILFLAIFHVV